jgi:(1->4)-alpha-D-glucan 1-alpha-D-glucosylmutase
VSGRERRWRLAPRATYRLQLHSEFTFADAAAIAPYIRRLGASHVYTSPILKARPGSRHGYDIVAHDELNPELGGPEGFERMAAEFKAAGLELLLDFVPNHVGVGGADNPLWLDVLEWGRESRYAGWFDIDWEPQSPERRERLLVPVLGDQYGIELDAGKLELVLDAERGELAVWAYGHHKLPLCPLSYGDVLGEENELLERFGDEFGELMQWRPQVVRRATELKQALAAALRDDASARAALAGRIARLNRADAEGTRRALDAVIAAQHWRAAHFRAAGDDINYRRFFNINDLAGLRIELPEVFEHVHSLVFDLMRAGLVAGLRIDHIDGLLEPGEYLERLRRCAGEAGVDDFYLVVEKILARGESLPTSWPVDGTTGYEFTSLALQLLVDPAGERPLTRFYREVSSDRQPFRDVVYASKLKIMRTEMAAELNVLARDALRIARQNPHTADFTHGLLRAALRELIANFPVYRTYVDSTGQCAAQDLDYIGQALAAARQRATEIDSGVLAFLARLLSGKLVAEPRSGFSRVAVLRLARKFQQLSGPVMAKGLEDTAFYRSTRFIALNEVGGDPATFGIDIDEFHAANAARAAQWPHSLLATATHDTKRGEDARARLAVLAECPDEWATEVREWRRLLGRADDDAPPDGNEELYFYQSLLGAWPAEFCVAEPDREQLEALAERLKNALVKALREGKEHSTWGAPNERYEATLLALVDGALGPAGAAFRARFAPFARRVARLGVENSLVQTALKLTLPGVPDIYQGTEGWDLSFVDPDNRRPVDFAARDAVLAEIEAAFARESANWDVWRRHWHDGRVKTALIVRLLALRARAAELFALGDYVPCGAHGAHAARLVAYLRRYRDRALLVAVRRFPHRSEREAVFQETRVDLPAGVALERDVLGGKPVAGRGALDVAALFRELPVAVLEARVE